MQTLFMDRDGVVNEQLVGDYVMDFSQLVYRPHFFEAMKMLRQRFQYMFLVTNQQCVGKGLCSMQTIDRIHEQMQQQLAEHDCAFDAVYCCPHHAKDQCSCRKPQPGMALRAKQEYPEVDFTRSIMVGDSLSDMQFAVNAGLLPVHVGIVRQPAFESIMQIAHHHFDDLLEFAHFVASNNQ